MVPDDRAAGAAPGPEMIMRPIETDRAAAPRRTVLWLLLDLLAFQVAVRLLFVVLRGLGPWWHSSVLGREQIRFAFELPAMIVAMAAGVLLVLPVLRRVSSGESWADLGLRRTSRPGAWASGAVIAAVGIGVAALLGLILPEMTLEVWRTLGIRTEADLVLFVFVVAPLFAALTEEVVYRGFMQSGLQRIHVGWGAVAAIVTFAAAHAYQGILSVLIFVLPVTILFTAARRLDPGLGPLMAAHLIMDVAIFAGFFLCDTRPDLHTVTCGLALIASATTLLATRRALWALLVDTRGWMSTLRGHTLRHLPWVVVFVLTAGAIAMGIQQLQLPVPVLGAVVFLVVGWQALRRRRG